MAGRPAAEVKDSPWCYYLIPPAASLILVVIQERQAWQMGHDALVWGHETQAGAPLDCCVGILTEYISELGVPVV